MREQKCIETPSITVVIVTLQSLLQTNHGSPGPYLQEPWFLLDHVEKLSAPTIPTTSRAVPAPIIPGM